MSNDVFYIISGNGKKVLRCTAISDDEFDYQVDLFALDEGNVYRSEWKSLTKDHVTTFIESGWDLSKTNPLAAAALAD